MIKTKNLSKFFLTGFLRKKIQALIDLNLEVAENEIFGFLGPNGAGKTTSIKLLTGLLKPSGGSIEVLNRDIKTNDMRAHMGYMPEGSMIKELEDAIAGLEIGETSGLIKTQTSFSSSQPSQ